MPRRRTYARRGRAGRRTFRGRTRRPIRRSRGRMHARRITIGHRI